MLHKRNTHDKRNTVNFSNSLLVAY